MSDSESTNAEALQRAFDEAVERVDTGSTRKNSRLRDASSVHDAIRGSVADLQPIWDRMADEADEEALLRLFVRFEDSARSLGFQVIPPRAVRALGPAARARFAGPAPRRHTSVTQSGARPSAPPTIPDADLAVTSPGRSPSNPPGPEDVRDRVARGLAQALNTTPSGRKLNTAKIQFLVSATFDQTLRGTEFHVGDILDAFDQRDEIPNEDLYLGLQRFRGVLRSMGLKLVAPDLGLTRERMTALDAEAKRGASTWVRFENSTSRGSIPPETTNTRGMTTVDGTMSGAPMRPSRWRPVFAAIFVAILAVIAVVVAPNKPILSGPYRAVFPLVSTRLTEGRFVGVIDEATWGPMTYADRIAAAKALTTLLVEREQIKGAAVVDQKNRVMVYEYNGNLQVPPR